MYYHGTKSLFNKFTNLGSGKHGLGFYFTKDFKDACAFAYTLAGDGQQGPPIVYHVNLDFNNLFNTMSVSHCEEVCRRLGTIFRINSNAGGAKEHYYYLAKQLKLKGISENINETLKDLGFDGILYDFMEHVVVFNPEQISIIKIQEV
jgi:hypothetical protein